MDFYSVVLLFFVYSFIGYVCEILYVSSIQRRFVDRGFLHGPICPVYGFGALLVIFLLKPVSHSIPILFISAVILTSVLEYFTGFLLETLFNTKWWDYSQYKFNIKGRVCLLNSLLFGILSLIGVRIIHPFLLHGMQIIHYAVIKGVSILLLVYFCIDLFYSVKKVLRFNEYLLLLGEFVENLKEKYGSEQWFMGHNLLEIFKTITDTSPQEKDRLHITPALLEKIQSFSQKTRDIDSFIRKFPSISSIRHKISLDHVKARIEQYKKGRRDK
ncbi:MAG TPA: putative ABC transporter permease [Treponemataceae bacterium]|nr:putative ABC transporter permease [Treponemataceae bacterium]